MYRRILSILIESRTPLLEWVCDRLDTAITYTPYLMLKKPEMKPRWKDDSLESTHEDEDEDTTDHDLGTK